MDTPINPGPTTYSNEYGKHLNEDVSRWFEYGVKPDGIEARGICSKRTALYAVLAIIFLIVMCVIIIVPVVIGNLYPKAK